jgi:hypothetical protein
VKYTNEVSRAIAEFSIYTVHTRFQTPFFTHRILTLPRNVINSNMEATKKIYNCCSAIIEQLDKMANGHIAHNI